MGSWISTPPERLRARAALCALRLNPSFEMVAVRGLRAALKRTCVAKLVKSRHGTAFQRMDASTKRASGIRFRGVTTTLATRVFNPNAQLRYVTDLKPGLAWRGADGARRRGCVVDAQVSRLAGVGKKQRQTSKKVRLTAVVFEALDAMGLEPVLGQRVCVDDARRIGTAVDVVALNGQDPTHLVLLELKVGFAGSRTEPGWLADARGRNVGEARFQPPFEKVKDCFLHRHLAQLSATTTLFKNHVPTMKALRDLGIKKVTGSLLYVCESKAAELYALPTWWEKRGDKFLNAMAAA